MVRSECIRMNQSGPQQTAVQSQVSSLPVRHRLYVQYIHATQKTRQPHYAVVIAHIKASGLLRQVKSLLSNQVKNRKNSFLCGGNCWFLLSGFYKEPSPFN